MTINPLRSRPPVEIPDRPRPTKAQKVAAWNRANGICWWCGKPVAADGPDVEWDHEVPRGLSADDSTDNLAPLHVHCHDRKTYGEDIPRIAKAKRQSKLTQPKQRKPGGFKGWRKMNGEIVWRRP
jgi:5-methylcytosine-specific restriction endonuclease McrA